MLWLDERDILILGIGGGGDVVSAAVYAYMLRRAGYRVVLGSIAWERYLVDPEPGPIPLESIVNCKWIGNHACLVCSDSYAVHGSRKVVFQAVNVAKVFGECAVLDLYSGVNGYFKGVREVLDYYGLGSVIGVDVGGDVLAYGLEDWLWSPLADAMGLATLNKLDRSLLIVHSLGSDGELPLDYLYERLSLVIKKRGLIAITGFPSSVLELLEKLLENAVSEASSISLYALKGVLGEVWIRRGSRKAYVSPHSLVSYVLNPHTVYEESLMARVVDNTSSLEEARVKLNSIGVYTEYDLEIDLKNLGIQPENVTSEVLWRVRESGRKRLKEVFVENR